MKAKNLVRMMVMALLALVLLGGAAVQAAQASSDQFAVSVYHGINGRSLGLSKELPVDVEIWKDGALLATIPSFTFGTRIDTMLPAGTYEIRVYAVELGGAPLPSMTVGPVALEAGMQVSLQAQLSGGKTPIIRASVK
jgi:hypothetical protein